MPNYEVTIKLDGEGSINPRSAAEGAYMLLLRDMLYGPLMLEVKDKETGEVKVAELEANLDNDETMLRFMALEMVASKFMTEEQERAQADWEVKNIDGHSVSGSEWPAGSRSLASCRESSERLRPIN